MNFRDIVVIADDIRSAHNVGSLLRTCEGLGVSKIFLCGYTPYPILKNDDRLPHIAVRINNRIIKTSLGAEESIAWSHKNDIKQAIKDLKYRGYTIVAVELEKSAIPLKNYKIPDKIAFIFGNERTGIAPEHLILADRSIYIPMLGNKESFNVVQSLAMVLYAARYIN